MLTVLLVVSSLFAGCANLGGADVRSDDYIANRAVQRWKELIDGDFAKAYLFESPAYRKVKSPGYYKGSFGAWTHWTHADVLSVKRVNEHLAVVRIALEYMFFPGRSGVAMKDVSYFDEKWRYVNNEWWHVSN